MEFGVCFKGVVSPGRLRRLVRQAETGGFAYCWFYDSHILWRDCCAVIALGMKRTTTMRFGPCVANPNVRDWSVAASLFASLARQSGGRFDLGLGRGDSSMRVMGRKPATLARIAEFARVVKALAHGEEVTHQDVRRRLRRRAPPRGMSRVEFGICFKGVVSPGRLRRLVRQAETGGFACCWFYDSHILWRDCCAVIALGRKRTTTMRFGSCVANPNIRDWSVAASLFASLARQSGGCFDLGLGRGDSSMRVMGRKPATLARVAEFARVVKALAHSEEVTYRDCPAPVQFSWAAGYELPVWIAAYGPRAPATAGERGDGVILQVAEPALVRWFVEQCHVAARGAGRDLSAFRVMAAAPAYFGAMDECIAAARWFPALVGNHVADIVEKYGADTDKAPRGLTAYIAKRRGYDYKKHAAAVCLRLARSGAAAHASRAPPSHPRATVKPPAYAAQKKLLLRRIKFVMMAFHW